MLLQAINKLIDATVKFKSLVDAGMQFDKSGYGALAWSIVSFGLEIAKNAEGAREFVFSSSEIITQLMERYLEYENLYRVLLTDDKFENRIMNVYKALLLYTIALNNYLTQSPWSKFLWPVSTALC